MAQLLLTPEHQELKTIVQGGKCIAFAGSGLSNPPGGDWKKLVNTIAKRCGVTFNDSIPTTEYPAVVDNCISINETGCNEALRAKLPAHVATSRTAIGYVLRLPFKALITTNFDPWIRQQSRMEKYKVTHVYPHLPLNDGLGNRIYYIHGFFDSEEPTSSIVKLVLGKKSFDEAYSESLLPGFLLNLFVYENVLFIGFNPLEEHISELLRRSISLRRQIALFRGADTASLPRRYILWPSLIPKSPLEQAKEDALINSLKALEITPVLFDKLASDYSGIEKVLLSWIEEGELKERPAPFDDTGFTL